MKLLISGLLLWSVVHFIPSIGIELKKKWVEALGQRGYTISFSILIVASLVLIVMGWRSTTPAHVYALPLFVKPVAIILMVFAFLLFGAAKHATRIKRFIRHPQLASIVVWSFAHLLLNGDSRSIVLFSWLGIWAILEMIFINRREGAWVKEPAPGWGQEFKGVAISLVIFVVAAVIHPYITGVPIK